MRLGRGCRSILVASLLLTGGPVWAAAERGGQGDLGATCTDLLTHRLGRSIPIARLATDYFHEQRGSFKPHLLRAHSSYALDRAIAAILLRMQSEGTPFVRLGPHFATNIPQLAGVSVPAWTGVISLGPQLAAVHRRLADAPQYTVLIEAQDAEVNLEREDHVTKRFWTHVRRLSAMEYEIKPSLVILAVLKDQIPNYYLPSSETWITDRSGRRVRTSGVDVDECAYAVVPRKSLGTK